MSIMHILHRQRGRYPNDFGMGGGAVVPSVILCVIMPIILHRQRGGTPMILVRAEELLYEVYYYAFPNMQNEHNRHLVRLDIDQFDSLSLIIKHEYCIH